MNSTIRFDMLAMMQPAEVMGPMETRIDDRDFELQSEEM